MELVSTQSLDFPQDIFFRRSRQMMRNIHTTRNRAGVAERAVCKGMSMTVFLTRSIAKNPIYKIECYFFFYYTLY